MTTLEGDTLKLDGPILMGTLCEVYRAGLDHLAGRTLTIDMAAVTEVDSSAVSLVLQWQRQAGQQNGAIKLVNLPANLLTLAKLYGVTELLPAVA